MSDTTILQAVQPLASAQPLACRLLHKEYVGRNGSVPFKAEIELENLSKCELSIQYEMAVLQYLDLIVQDAHGNVVSDHHFGDRFSPFDESRLLRLGPGEKFHSNVHLFATMPRGPIAAGIYFVKAVYEYDGFRAESETLQVTVEQTIEQ